MSSKFNIHGDNIVECDRVLSYICAALDVHPDGVAGPTGSVTCPIYTMEHNGRSLVFQHLPGYGEHRWNQDVLSFIKRSGGRLREAADAILTSVVDGVETPLVAIEFCSALPAGNQAWQRHGRALSFSYACIPYFFVAELGGFELNAERKKIAPRMPNPTVPFSLLAMTLHGGSVCLPVYEPNAGATVETSIGYRTTFGRHDFLQFIKVGLLGGSSEEAVTRLKAKCIALVKILADSRVRSDGLTSAQWEGAYNALRGGQSLIDFLQATDNLQWKKKTSTDLSNTAKRFMDLGAQVGRGLTSSTLPLCFVSRSQRRAFAKSARQIYRSSLSREFVAWLAESRRDLAIAWVMGFKPGGEDARPERGLPPMARMLVGNDTDLLTFVFGPVPTAHWKELVHNHLKALSDSNGLWEAILETSDACLIDGNTGNSPHGFVLEPTTGQLHRPSPLCVSPRVLSLGEQDVDTALHVLFRSLGPTVAFEGLCNPPGGDWSGISFRWVSMETEFRWLTLPRVSANGKRPDHILALFGHGSRTVCLCVESKDVANSLETKIGPRLRRYTESLLTTAPSVSRDQETDAWRVYDSPWRCPQTTFVSAGAYLGTTDDPFQRIPSDTELDIQIAVAFFENASRCVLHLRGDTETGRSIIESIASHQNQCERATIEISN